MPMMMDDDLDDLFVDAPQLQLPLPVSNGLLQCVDDLRLSGCCQYVSESQEETACRCLTSRQEDCLVEIWLHCIHYPGWSRSESPAFAVRPQRWAVEVE